MTILPPKYLTSIRTNQQSYWYQESEDIHRHIFTAIHSLESSQSQRQRNNAKYLALYENVETYSPSFLRTSAQDSLSSKLTFNVIKSCIDSAASKIGKNEPKPEFITTQGDFRTRKKADTLTQYVEGVFYDNSLYDIAPDVFIDACLYGTGAVSIFSDGERIRYDRVDINEILVDDFDGIYRKPKQLFHVRPVFRALLQDKFKDDSQALDAINKAPSVQALSNSLADRILVAEAWYLPTIVKPQGDIRGTSTDGKHVVCVENHTLLNEPYAKDSFPFAFFRWSNRRKSFYGQGLAEELVPTQLKLARLVQHVDRNLKNTGLRVFIDSLSEINPNHLTDERSPITSYTGQPPIVATWPAVAPEVYQWIENLYRKAFEITGISQMTAFAQKPSGVTAGIAMQTLADTQTERFMLTGKRYESFFMEIAKITIDLSRDLYQSNKSLTVKTAYNGFLSMVSWKDADLDEDHYILQCFPVSAFASSPAARLQQVTDMMNLGVINQKRAMQMLGNDPDVKDFINSETASMTRVMKILDKIKHEGKYTDPDIYLDLTEATELTLAEINRSIIEAVPEDHIQLMRNFISDIQDLQGIGQQQAISPPDIAALPPQQVPQQAPQPPGPNG